MRDLRIQPGAADRSDNDAFVWSVIAPSYDYVEVEAFRDQDALAYTLTPLTPGQRALVAIHWLVAEVCNGGFHQFFYNSTGVVWREALDGLGLVGAAQVQSLLRHALSCFPASAPPFERFQRQRVLEGIDEDAFDPIDDAFYPLLPDLYAASARYVEAHQEEFFRPGESAA